jgi:hypothetical protein
MPNTTNNNWPTPADTDLVKNGADAIRDLGNAIDTTLGVYAQSGFVKLNTTSFSAVSSQSINDVFSATYDIYRIVITGSTSAALDLDLKLRVSATDASTNYFRGCYQATSGGSSSLLYFGNSLTTGMTVYKEVSASSYFSTSFDVYRPFTSNGTAITGLFQSSQTLYSAFFGGAHSTASSYTGFTLIPSSGTITGSVSVYGYNK